MLCLPDSEVDAALADLEYATGLVAFAKRHNQSLDWIVQGNVRCMIAALAGFHPGQTKHPDEDED